MMKTNLTTIFLLLSGILFCQDYQNLTSHYPEKYKWKKSESYLRYLGYWNQFKEGDVIADIGTYNASIPLAISVYSNHLTFYLQECQHDRLNKNGFYEMKEFYEKVKGEKISNQFHFVIGNGSQSNLPDSSFDKIMLNSVLEYVGNCDLFLKDLKRKLKPWGEIYLTSSNPYDPDYFIKIFKANGFTCVDNSSKRGIVKLVFATGGRLYPVEDVFDAVLRRNPEKTNEFLSKTNVNKKLGKASLLLAALSVSENEKLVSMLLEKGAEINVDRKLIFCLNPLSKTCAAGQSSYVKLLLEKGAKAEREDIMMCAWFGHDAQLLNMLKGRADKNTNKPGLSALYFACQAGEEGAAEVLLQDYKKPLFSLCDTVMNSSWKGQSILHWIAQSNNVNWMRKLAGAGGDLNLRDEQGNTMLIHAVWGGNLEMVRFLVEEAKADLSAKNKKGFSALAYAYDPELRSYLVKMGLKEN